MIIIIEEVLIAGKGQHDHQGSGHVNRGSISSYSSNPCQAEKKGRAKTTVPASTLNRHVSRAGGWRLRNEETKERILDMVFVYFC